MAFLLGMIPLLAQAGVQGPTLDDSLSPAIKLAIAVGVIGGSFVLGSLLARALKMPDYAFKIGLVLCTVFAAIAIDVLAWPPKLGIDLSGGVVLVYEVDPQTTRIGDKDEVLRQINSRLSTIKGATVSAQISDSGQLEIPLSDPKLADKVRAEVKKASSTAIQFQPVRQRKRADGLVLVYDVQRQEQTVDMDELVNAVSRRINPGGVKEVTVRQYGSAQVEVIVPEVEEREVELIKQKISTAGLLEFRIVANRRDHADIIALAKQSPGRDVYQAGKVVGRWVKLGEDVETHDTTLRKADDGSTEVLMVIDPFNVDGGYLTQATQGFDERGGFAVFFNLDSVGANLFRGLTSTNLPDTATGFYRRLGIVLDNVLLSAPQINNTITGSGQINGSFTQDQVKFLVGILNAGRLPAALQKEPISEQKVSAQLGEDTIRSGAYAMMVSTGLVLLFMLMYYHFAGMVADVAVLLNMLLTVALMLLIKAAFTLPGLAGLVLTVGMAVDANVLIYERMREESQRGASLRMSIRNGFSRAMSTIIDSNLTTLITAAVLYAIGTDQIKGFAVTLILGLLVSMYTAIYVARLIFDIAERKHWITQLSMMRIIGETHFDFVRWLKPAMAASAVVIFIGLAAAAKRGNELFDIDFTGGSSVQIVLASGKEMDIVGVNELVDKAGLPDVSVTSVGTENREYKIDTSDRKIAKVQQSLEKAFRGRLQTYSMSFDKFARIEPEKTTRSEKPRAERDDEEAAAAPVEQPPVVAPAPDAKKPAAPAVPAPAENRPARQPRKGALRTFPSGAQVASTASMETILATLAVGQNEKKGAAVRPAPANADGENPVAGKNKATEKPERAAQKVERSESGKAKRTAAERKAKAAAPEDVFVPGRKTPSRAAPIPESLAGGTRVELKFRQPISYVGLRDRIEQQLEAAGHKSIEFQLRNSRYTPGSSHAFENWTLLIALPAEQTREVLGAISRELGQTPVFPSSSTVGGRVAGKTKEMAVYAMLASLVMIVIYVWIRFQNAVFGFAAVLALIHDVLVTIGFLALSLYLSPYLGFLQVDPFKISLAVVAALLTIVGFSINDTIVIFDRIREVRGKSPQVTADMVNLSVNQTLGRTILTSGTVLIATIILYFFGGQGIHAFAYAMLVGLVAGTYSTVYIAAPIVLWFKTDRPAPNVRQPLAPQSAAR